MTLPGDGVSQAVSDPKYFCARRSLRQRKWRFQDALARGASEYESDIFL